MARATETIAWPLRPNAGRGDLYTVALTGAEKVLLSRLPAGGRCDPHVDATERVRYHIPILTNPDCFFCTEDGRYHMVPGEVYEVDPRRVHWVENNGATDRVHLILDYLTPCGAFSENVRRIT